MPYCWLDKGTHVHAGGGGTCPRRGRGHVSTRGEGARVHAGERGTRIHAVGTGSTITRGGKDGRTCPMSIVHVHAARRRGTRVHVAGREGAVLFYNPMHSHR